MADVSIIQQPNQLHPIYNPAWYVVSGTHYASANYKLIARITDANNNTIKTLKQPTAPDSPTATCFDVHRILESYVTQTIDLSLTKIDRALNNFIPYYIEFGEEYGTPPTEHFDDIYSAEKFGLNIALSPKDFKGWAMSSYISGGGSRKFLNKYKGTRKVISSNKAFAYFCQDLNTASGIDGIAVIAYNKAGSVIQTSTIVNSYIGTQDDEMVLYCPAGVSNLNLIPTSQLSGATLGNVIPSTTAYYDLNILWDGSQYGEFIRYEIVNDCSKYPNYTLYFLGQYGNIEIWNFNRKSEKTSQISRSTYKAGLGRFISPAVYGYELSDRQTTQFDTLVTDMVTLNSDNLSEAELGFLQELVQSPQVWSLEDGSLIPVIVRNPNFNLKQKVNDKIFNLTLDIEYSSALELQRY